MIASYFPVSAKVRAASGISNAPGTRTRSISFLFEPERTSPSTALSKSRSVMNALNRETTIAKRLPEALSVPSSAGKSGRGRGSTIKSFLCFFCFFAVTPCLRGGFARSTLCSSVSPGLEPLILLPLKRRRPLLQKRRSAFPFIFGRAGHGEQHRLQIQPLRQGHLHALVHGLHGVLHRQRSVGDDLRRNRFRPWYQLGRNRNFI